MRTWADWDNNVPGFLEVDLVGHDGGDLNGSSVAPNLHRHRHRLDREPYGAQQGRQVGIHFLGERYRRIARRRGKKKAIVAVGGSILVIIWHLLAEPDAGFKTSAPTTSPETSTPRPRRATTPDSSGPSATESPSPIGTGSPPGPAQHPWTPPPGNRSAPALPRRQPQDEPRPPRCRHCAAAPRHRRTRLLSAQTHRRQDPAGSAALPQTTTLRRRLPTTRADAHAAEETGPGGHCGATQESSAADLPRTSTLRISHFPDPRNRPYSHLPQSEPPPRPRQPPRKRWCTLNGDETADLDIEGSQMSAFAQSFVEVGIERTGAM